VVSSSPFMGCENIRVSARVYYTRETADDEVTAISASIIMRFDQVIWVIDV
jgi:hypothetical protein